MSPTPLLRATIHDVATYLTTPPLRAPDGGFFSAEDADSSSSPSDAEKREGAFYVWTLKELRALISTERDADVLARYYGVKENGNVAPEYDAHDELINQNVLAVSGDVEVIAKELGMSKKQVEDIVEEGRRVLREHREKMRPRPALDDKIVTAWNGLAIGGLARTASVLESLDSATEEDRSKAHVYRQAAEDAAAFIKKELYDETNGLLWRIYREGRGDAPAFADDYAFLISGLIDLYEATFDDHYLAFADRLQQSQISLFWDVHHWGFFSTAADASDLILRLKDGMDNAEPSTNGVTASNLYRLSSLLNDPEFDELRYSEYARRTLEAFSAEMIQHPYLFAGMLKSVVASNLGVKSTVISGPQDKVEQKIRQIRTRRPNLLGTVAKIGEGSKCTWLKGRNELVASMDETKPAIQTCEGGVCSEEIIP
ncbi:MAG: hypothetical protein M1822_010178 [Bathelium mastoideum]|nr:MAG: hypothetical protein M1822_010178 [Bathelium mastoideum]